MNSTFFFFFFEVGVEGIIFILQAASVACEEVLDILSLLLVTVAYSTSLEKVACNT